MPFEYQKPAVVPKTPFVAVIQFVPCMFQPSCPLPVTSDTLPFEKSSSKSKCKTRLGSDPAVVWASSSQWTLKPSRIPTMRYAALRLFVFIDTYLFRFSDRQG